jgi:hypothetical protein
MPGALAIVPGAKAALSPREKFRISRLRGQTGETTSVITEIK